MPRIKSKPVIIGIDPGKKGGVSFLHADKILIFKMPETELDILELFKHRHPKNHIAYIEHLWGNTGRTNSGPTMFKLGVNYGALRMAVLACGIRLEQVTPRTWQKELGIPPKKKTESQTQWKNRLKAKAQQLFPGLNITHATADALLIAEFGRRVRK